MTNREFYNAFIRGENNDEMREFAEHALAQIDHTNELRRNANLRKAAEKETERAPLRQAIVECITAEPKTATMLIAEAGVELKPQSVPSLLRGLVADGSIVKRPVKIQGKGTQVGYALPEAE